MGGWAPPQHNVAGLARDHPSPRCRSLVVVIDGSDISSVASETGPTLFGAVEVGSGIYITGLGAVSGVISAVTGFRRPPALVTPVTTLDSPWTASP